MTSNPFTAARRTSGLLSEFSAWIKAWMGEADGKAAEPNAWAAALRTAGLGSLAKTPIRAWAAESESCPNAARFQAALMRSWGLLEVLVRMPMAF